jgi:hypothetical protein
MMKASIIFYEADQRPGSSKYIHATHIFAEAAKNWLILCVAHWPQLVPLVKERIPEQIHATGAVVGAELSLE